MTIKLNGIEFEFPDGASVEISEDGQKVKVSGVPVTEPEVIEKIRIVEVAVPGPETIRYVPQAQQTWPTWPKPLYPSTPIWTQPYIPTTTGTAVGGSFSGVSWSGFLNSSQNDGGDASYVGIN